MNLFSIDKVPGFIPMIDRDFPEFRQKIYTYMKTTLSPVMTRDDLNIIVLLIAELFGDLYLRAKKLPWEIDVDKCPDEHLKSLSSIVGYKWNNAFTPDEQRESIKLFCLIRSWRGTNFGLSNLIRVFGQDASKFYSSSDLRGVEIVEYGSGGIDTVEPNMFPGDIKIKIPEFSNVLRESISDTKLAGTRIIFLYYIFIGVFHLKMYEDFYYKIDYWIKLITSGYNPRIDKYGSVLLDTKISQVLNDQLTHCVVNGKPIASCQVLTYYKEPWQNGFVLNVKGLINYRGFIESDPTIVSNEVIYA